MAFEMIDSEEWFGERIGYSLSVKNSHQQRARQPWTLSDRYGIEVFEGDAGLNERRAYDRHEIAEMFARGQFGDDASIARM